MASAHCLRQLQRPWRLVQRACSPAILTHETRSLAAMASSKPIVRGIVFDMDGTLTVPVIDFAYMRQQVGVHSGDILDVISSWPAEEQQKAYAKIAAIEDQALLDMKTMPGLLELCSYLDQQGVARGLITRNVKRSIEYFHNSNHFPLPPFIPAISRECAFPYKPSPAALQHICQCWGISPAECIMVGDSAKDDVVCGNRAGSLTVLIDTEGRFKDNDASLQGEQRPTVRVTSMEGLQQWLAAHVELLPTPAAAQSAAA